MVYVVSLEPFDGNGYTRSFDLCFTVADHPKSNLDAVCFCTPANAHRSFLIEIVG